MKLLLLILCLIPLVVHAADPEIAEVIRDHRFVPAEVKIPAGKKIKLMVHNQDSTPEEFESYELNREKLIAPGAITGIYIGPLKPGRYPFFGDFNAKTAQGAVVVE